MYFPTPPGAALAAPDFLLPTVSIALSSKTCTKAHIFLPSAPDSISWLLAMRQSIKALHTKKQTQVAKKAKQGLHTAVVVTGERLSDSSGA